jgi:hypothetical protein
MKRPVKETSKKSIAFSKRKKIKDEKAKEGGEVMDVIYLGTRI